MTDETPVSSTLSEEHEGVFPLWLVMILGIGVVACAIFSIPIFGSLYGIVFPPAPPLPDFSSQTEKTVIDHGVEETRYTSSLNPCQVVQFYINEGGVCEVLWDVCIGDQFTTRNRSFIPFGMCTGTTSAGAFGIRWTVDIDLLYPPDQTVFVVSHEVLWGGMPRPTSTIPIPD
ncbi:MAG: hypothetical protein SH821_10135 [Phototrophicales bacterium]|nr:hypothetical protein [Phototrophicales bacterium]